MARFCSGRRVGVGLQWLPGLTMTVCGVVSDLLRGSFARPMYQMRTTGEPRKIIFGSRQRGLLSVTCNSINITGTVSWLYDEDLSRIRESTCEGRVNQDRGRGMRPEGLGSRGTASTEVLIKSHAIPYSPKDPAYISHIAWAFGSIMAIFV